MGKRRLDTLLAERGLFPSRSRAAASVMAGEVRVGRGERRAEKPGEMIETEELIRVEPGAAYVSRGGVKLANALDASGVAVAGRVALDVGASTGGFTDCLLQRGAAHVIAVDVGYGTLDYRLRRDPRVTVLERTNARELTPERLAAAVAAGPASAAPDGGETAAPAGETPALAGGTAAPAETGALGEATAPGEAMAPGETAAPAVSAVPQPDLAVLDVSFISLTKVLAPVLACLAPRWEALAMIKPQFEVGRERVGKGGVVRDAGDRRDALIAVGKSALALGAAVVDYHSSGLAGPKGNLETFIHLVDPAGGVAGAKREPAALEALARRVEP